MGNLFSLWKATSTALKPEEIKYYDGKLSNSPILRGQTFDLLAWKSLMVLPKREKLVDTGIILYMNPNALYFCLLCDMNNEDKCLLGAGVVDPGYRNTLRVLLKNLKNKNVYHIIGKSICSMVFLPVMKPLLHTEKHPALIPKRFTKDSVGYDLLTPTSFEIQPNQQIDIDTKIKIESQHYIPCVFDKSSVAYNKNCAVVAGIADDSETIRVSLRNFGKSVAIFQFKDAIAQLIFFPNAANGGKMDSHPLFTPKPFVLSPGEKDVINIDLKLTETDNNVYCIFEDLDVVRSKNTIVCNRIYDPMRGEVFQVHLRNVGSTSVSFETGEVIARFIMLKTLVPILIPTDRFSDNTERGTRGFGGKV